MQGSRLRKRDYEFLSFFRLFFPGFEAGVDHGRLEADSMMFTTVLCLQRIMFFLSAPLAIK